MVYVGVLCTWVFDVCVYPRNNGVGCLCIPETMVCDVCVSQLQVYDVFIQGCVMLVCIPRECDVGCNVVVSVCILEKKVCGVCVSQIQRCVVSLYIL